MLYACAVRFDVKKFVKFFGTKQGLIHKGTPNAETIVVSIDINCSAT